MSEDLAGNLTLGRITVALVVISIAAAVGGAGTFAAFQDAEDSNGNQIQTGTLDLHLTDHGSEVRWTTAAASVPGSYTARGGFDFVLWNNGTIDADRVSISFNNSGIEDTDGNFSNGIGVYGPESDELDGATNMSKWVNVTEYWYDMDQDGNFDEDEFLIRGDVLVDANGNGFVDLWDLEHNSTNIQVLRDLPAPPTNQQSGVEGSIEVQLHSGLPNDYQGDILNTTIEFKLHQE